MCRLGRHSVCARCSVRGRRDWRGKGVALCSFAHTNFTQMTSNLRAAGCAVRLCPPPQVDLHVGTLSKAFGALGGFVACSRAMKQLLLNRGRAYVYSTSLPVPVVEAAAAALRVSSRCVTYERGLRG